MSNGTKPKTKVWHRATKLLEPRSVGATPHFPLRASLSSRTVEALLLPVWLEVGVSWQGAGAQDTGTQVSRHFGYCFFLYFLFLVFTPAVAFVQSCFCASASVVLLLCFRGCSAFLSFCLVCSSLTFFGLFGLLVALLALLALRLFLHGFCLLVLPFHPPFLALFLCFLFCVLVLLPLSPPFFASYLCLLFLFHFCIAFVPCVSPFCFLFLPWLSPFLFPPSPCLPALSFLLPLLLPSSPFAAPHLLRPLPFCPSHLAPLFWTLLFAPAPSPFAPPPLLLPPLLARLSVGPSLFWPLWLLWHLWPLWPWL